MWETFVDLDFCPRMVQSRNCNLWTQPVLKVTNLKIYISETVSASARMARTTFIDLDIFERMIDVIARFTPNDLDLLFKVKHFNCNMSETFRASANMRNDLKYLAF